MSNNRKPGWLSTELTPKDISIDISVIMEANEIGMIYLSEEDHAVLFKAMRLEEQDYIDMSNPETAQIVKKLHSLVARKTQEDPNLIIDMTAEEAAYMRYDEER